MNAGPTPQNGQFSPEECQEYDRIIELYNQGAIRQAEALIWELMYDHQEDHFLRYFQLSQTQPVRTRAITNPSEPRLHRRHSFP